MKSPFISLRSALVKAVDWTLASLIVPEKLLIREWEGKGASTSSDKNGVKRKLCLFSHFDLHDLIDEYVVYYLKSLHQLGADIVFVSTSENLSNLEVEKIKPYCLKIISRKNLGLDFGSWNLAWRKLKSNNINLQNYEKLILANDSVYGPLFPLENVFQEMESRTLDFWSITSNPELTYHLQSYFLVFSQSAFLSENFDQFWQKFKHFRSKNRIIHSYELGWSVLAKRINWKFGAYSEASNTPRPDANPTLFSWEFLIEKLRCPFLKTEVLKLNRGNSARIGEWKTIISQESSYPVQLIEEHLRRLGIER